MVILFAFLPFHPLLGLLRTGHKDTRSITTGRVRSILLDSKWFIYARRLCQSVGEVVCAGQYTALHASSGSGGIFVVNAVIGACLNPVEPGMVGNVCSESTLSFLNEVVLLRCLTICLLPLLLLIHRSSSRSLRWS